MAIIEIPVERKGYTLPIFSRSHPNYKWGTPSAPDTLFKTTDDIWISFLLYASHLNVLISCKDLHDARNLVKFTETRNSAPIRFKRDKDSGRLYVSYPDPEGRDTTHDYKAKPNIQSMVCFGDDEIHSSKYETDYLKVIKLDTIKIETLGGKRLLDQRIY